MREAVIVISDLYLREQAQPRTLPLRGLETIARYGTRRALDGDWRSWVSGWVGREDLAGAPVASVAAAALATESTTATGYVWMATPIQLVAGLRSVHVGETLPLSQSSLTALAQDFNSTFRDSGFRLEALTTHALLLRGPATEAQTCEPSRCVGADAASVLPKGANVAPLLRLSSEIEMWLHSHPVNAARAQRHEPAVGTLWLWGGGPERPMSKRIRAAGKRAYRAFGTDAWLQGLQRLNDEHALGLPARFDEQLAESPDDVLVVVEAAHVGGGLPWDQALAQTDQRWITPARELVDRGRIGQVTILANDRELSYRRHARLKAWRRPRTGLAALT